MDTRGICIFSLTAIIFCTVFIISDSKKTYSLMKADIPFIKCDVCKKGIKYVYHKAQDMKQESPKQKIEEEKLQDLVEKACNPDTFDGEWLTKLDVVENNDNLVLVEHEDLGSCKTECRTVAKACQETVGEADVDIAEELWKNELSLSKLINQVCYSDTNACAKSSAKFKSGTRKDEKFHVMSEDEKKAQAYMKQASGMPGMPNMEMYSRDDMEEMVKTAPKVDDQAQETSHSTNEQGSIIWQTIVQVFQDIWAWIRQLFGLKTTNTEEL